MRGGRRSFCGGSGGRRSRWLKGGRGRGGLVWSGLGECRGGLLGLAGRLPGLAVYGFVHEEYDWSLLECLVVVAFTSVCVIFSFDGSFTL